MRPRAIDAWRRPRADAPWQVAHVGPNLFGCGRTTLGGLIPGTRARYVVRMVSPVFTGFEPWPLFGIELTVKDLVLSPLRESDIASLVSIYPDDAEHDPGEPLWSHTDLEANRQRLLTQGYWRNWGSWSPDSWCLTFRVVRSGVVVGVQSLEAGGFPTLRTVDSGSWLSRDARGRGIGTMMRTAVLALAFDHLGAQWAISASRPDNVAALAISRRLGYVDNGISRVLSPTGPCELRHLRLDRADWLNSKNGDAVGVHVPEECAPYFGVETV